MLCFYIVFIHLLFFRLEYLNIQEVINVVIAELCKYVFFVTG